MKGLAATFLFLAGVAQAGPDVSLRPVARADSTLTLDASGAIARQRTRSSAEMSEALGQGLTRSVRPEMRSRKIARLARERERLLAQGAVCGDPAIQGDVVGHVQGKRAGCGLQDAVRVRSVAGVALSQRAIMDCPTAQALKTWIETSAKPGVGRTGGGLKSLRIAAHYVCRTRNSKPGGRVSEHGKGRAIDISALRLKDGTLITVQNGWNAASSSAILRRVHKGACGPFGTVLGPDADKYHRDHFHFDTARYRSGPYCR